MLDEDEDDRLQKFLRRGGEQPGQGKNTGSRRGENSGGGCRDQCQEDDQGDDNDEEFQDIVKTRYHSVQVFQRRGDRLALPPDFHTGCLQLLHGDVAVHVAVEHGERGFSFFAIVKRLLQIAGEDGIKAIAHKGSIQPPCQGLASRCSAQEGQNDGIRLGAVGSLAAGEVCRHSTRHIAHLLHGTLGYTLGPSSIAQRGLEATVVVFGFLLEIGVRVGDFVAGKAVEFRQAADLELVDFDPVCICARVEANGDQLNDELLNEIQDRPDEEGNDELVEGVLPGACAMILVDMVIFHGGQERDFHTQPPEEDGGVEFELLCHIAPFLCIVGEDTGQDAHGDGDCFGHDLR